MYCSLLKCSNWLQFRRGDSTIEGVWHFEIFGSEATRNFKFRDADEHPCTVLDPNIHDHKHD